MVLKKSNKTAIVTGSSRGLGANIVEFLVYAGFNVVINYNERKKDAEILAEKLVLKDNIRVFGGDVSKFSDVKRIVNKTLMEFGRIDVLINNAGIHKDGTVHKLDERSWRSVIDTNLTGTFFFSKAVLPQMKKQGFGRIINISSVTALTGTIGASNYAASKAGIIGFTKSLAREVGKYNITVNAIAPGYFDTGMFNDFTLKMKNKIISNIPANRLGHPSEISELIKILLLSNYLTGQVFVLDGGYSIGFQM